MDTKLTNAMNSGFAEEIASHSIRANHELIEDICLSRQSIDRINDDFPEIIAIIGEDGAILRGNKVLATLMEVDVDDIIDFTFESLFTASSWQIFLKEIGNNRNSKSFSFELASDGLTESRLIYWTLSKFVGLSDRRGALWAVLGTDITEQRLAENRLSMVFSTIPLGVMTINREGKIEWPYSKYCKVLLDTDDLTGRTIEDGLFGRSHSQLNSMEKEKIRFLKGVFGQDLSWFEMVRSQLPVEVPVQHSDGTLVWLSMSYSPVVDEDVIEKMLIVIEDITKRVLDRKQNDLRNSKEMKISRVIIDLQAIEPDFIDSAIEDIDGYLIAVGEVIDKSLGTKSFCGCLHGIKGVARTINLSDLKVFVHDMESRLLAESEKIDADSGGLLLAEFAALRAEWSQIRTYANLIRSIDTSEVEGSTPNKKIELSRLEEKQNSAIRQIDRVLQMQQNASEASFLTQELLSLRDSVCQMSYIKAETISDKLNFICASTAKKLGKNAELSLQFDGVEVSRESLTKLTEVFLHLITNALDHAIESPDVRKKNGKSQVGKINIHFEKTSDKSYACKFEDDGAGIDIDKVKAVAVKKGILKEGERVTRTDAMNLILCNNFSTASTVTETSGRGIGLTAAVEAIESLNAIEGLRVASTELGKGTVFTFTIKS